MREDLDILNQEETEDPSPWYGVPDEGDALARGYNSASRYVTRVLKHATKTLVLNRGMLMDADNKLIPEGVPFPDPGGEVQYTWHQVPEEFLPQGVWGGNANSVNDAEFDSYPAGTLLFDGNTEVRSSPNPMTGQVLSDVTYRFRVSFKLDDTVSPKVLRGHRYIWRNKRIEVSPGVFESRLVPVFWTVAGTSSTPKNPLREFDFRNFFRPRQPSDD